MSGSEESIVVFHMISRGRCAPDMNSTARVNLPAVTMPERSYLRSSLAEMADAIRNGLSEAVVEAVVEALE